MFSGEIKMSYYDGDEGSFAGGFWLGLIFGIIGIIMAIAIDRPRTRRGSVLGCILSIPILFVLLIIYLEGFA